MNIQKMMLQAQAMQGKVQAELEALRLEGSAGGGLVRIEMTGAKEILAVRIDPSAVDPSDVEMLQDLVLAALRDARSEERTSELQSQSNLVCRLLLEKKKKNE